MTERTTETQITFNHPFQISALHMPLAPGTYRVTTDEEMIEGLSNIAYRRTATMLHIPAIGLSGNTEQRIGVDPAELYAAQVKDVEAD